MATVAELKKLLEGRNDDEVIVVVPSYQITFQQSEVKTEQPATNQAQNE